MRLWKAPLATQIDGATDELREDARAYCFAKKIVGLGWGLGDLIDRDSDNPEDYQRIVEQHQSRLQETWNISQCLSNHRRFAELAQKGDLVWSRSRRTGYWVGKLSTGWRYGRDEVLSNYDLNQYRGCEWQAVGDAVEVPGAIINQFAGRGLTFSEIHAGGETLIYLSEKIYSQKSGQKLSVPRPENFSLFDNIAHPELENLVAIYLQAVHGWHVVPSTVKKSTPLTEFSMVNARGEIAGVQVKAGVAAVPNFETIPPDIHRFYVFEALPQFRIETQPEVLRPLLRIIRPDELLQWAVANLQMIPNPVRILLKSE